MVYVLTIRNDSSGYRVLGVYRSIASATRAQANHLGAHPANRRTDYTILEFSLQV